MNFHFFGSGSTKSTTTVVEENNGKPSLPANFQWETLPVPSDSDLAEVRSNAVETVPKRTTEPDEACKEVGHVYGEVYSRVIGDSKLGLIKTKLEEAIKNGKEQLAGAYQSACEAAKKIFVDSCLPHVEEMAGGREKQLEEARALREENEGLETQITDYAKRLTGDPDIKVPQVDRMWLFGVSALVGTIVTVLDVFLGAPSFAFGSNDKVAYAMSFAFGFAYGVTIYFWATAAKRLVSYEDAQKALESYKKRNRRDPKVQSLELIEPYNEEQYYVSNMKTLFKNMSMVLLIASIFASRESATMMAVGLTATVMIVVVSLVGFFIEKRMAPPYGYHHEKIQALSDKVDDNDERIEEILNPNAEQDEPEWLAKAKKEFQNDMELAWTKINNDITEAHGHIANYRQLLNQSRDFAGGLRDHHVGTCLEVIGEVLSAQAVRDNLEKINYSFDKARAAGFLTLPLFNDPFTAQIESGAFNPEEMRPARIAGEPNRILQELLTSTPKPQQAPKPKRPIINITTL